MCEDPSRLYLSVVCEIRWILKPDETESTSLWSGSVGTSLGLANPKPTPTFCCFYRGCPESCTREAKMILVKCNKCKKVIEFIKVDAQTSISYLDYWRKVEQHLCNHCWVEAFKKKTNIDLQKSGVPPQLVYKPNPNVNYDSTPWPHDQTNGTGPSFT